MKADDDLTDELNRRMWRAELLDVLRGLAELGQGSDLRRAGDGRWYAFSYEASKEVLSNRLLVSPGSRIPVRRGSAHDDFLRSAMPELEGDQHREARFSVSALFTPDRLLELGTAVRAWCDSELAGVDGDADIVKFGDDVGLVALATLLRLPIADAELICAAARTWIAAAESAADPKVADLAFADLLARWRVLRREDYLLSIFVAGVDSTGWALANIVALVQSQGAPPGIERKLVSTELHMVDELLRLGGPMLAGPPRVAVRPLSIAGVDIAAGAEVTPIVAAANCDTRVFDEPFEIRLERRPRHLSLGFGRHLCLGQAVARVAIQSALSALFEEGSLGTVREKERRDDLDQLFAYRTLTADLTSKR